MMDPIYTNYKDAYGNMLNKNFSSINQVINDLGSKIDNYPAINSMLHHGVVAVRG